MKSIDKIVETLIINGTLIEQPGLFYGKTGIAVFFFHYARQTNNTLFQNYAFDLIEEIQQQITVTFPARYDVGIAGIGTCFEYFLQNNFLEADDDIFEDFDARMYRAAFYEPYPDLSLEGGITGWGRYFIYRLKGSGEKNIKLHEALTHIANFITQKVLNNEVLENEQPDVYRFLYDITKLSGYEERYRKASQLSMKWECIHQPEVNKFFPYMHQLPRLYACMNYFKIDLTEKINLEWEKWKEIENHSLSNMGLLNGWTSEGLMYLLHMHQTDFSWLQLF